MRPEEYLSILAQAARLKTMTRHCWTQEDRGAPEDDDEALLDTGGPQGERGGPQLADHTDGDAADRCRGV